MRIAYSVRMSKQKQYHREQFDDDLLTCMEQGRIIPILNGANVLLVAPQNLKPHHHVIAVAEAARRLNLKHQPEPRGLRRLWRWLVD